MPQSIAALPADVQRRLADQIRAAERRQTETADRAVEVAVRGVPLPVRGIVRKALT